MLLVGVAQVVDDWAIPFSSRSSGGVGELVLFVARRFISARFAALLNTGNNTCFLVGVEAWGHPCSPTLAADQCLSGKA